MIKARSIDKRDGDVVIFLGLSRANTERLHNDQPIMIDLKEVALPGYKVMIVAGETEANIAKQLMDGGVELSSGPPPESSESE